MVLFRRVFFVVLVLLASCKMLFATPQFAREYKLDCLSCHTTIPALNDMGRMFLRNGFRFSLEDKTTWEKLIHQKDSNSTYIPVGLLVGVEYNSLSDDAGLEPRILSAGTLTKRVSYYISLTKEKQKGYVQYNIGGDKHVFRAGLLSPFTQISSVNKASAGSGLKGNNGNDGSTNSEEGDLEEGGLADVYSQKNFSIKGEPIEGSGVAMDDNNASGEVGGDVSNQENGEDNGNGGGNQPYKTPIQNSYFRDYWGVEYSYLYNYNITFMISFGRTLDNSTDKKDDTDSSNNADNDLDPDSADKNEFTLGVRYQTQNSYYIGLMLDKIFDSDKTNFSTLAFLEKSYKKFMFYMAFIYKNNIDMNDYYGIENTVIYQINNMSNLKLIVDVDEDEDGFNNRGFSLTYGRMQEIFSRKFLFGITCATRKTETKEDDILQLSAKMAF